MDREESFLEQEYTILLHLPSNEHKLDLSNKPTRISSSSSIVLSVRSGD
jgi:hypothetical protein